ncbi:Protein FAM71B [Varanus komodoensis]|nr:Protein FAM71B [Varanus komodoensis]
MKPLGEVIQSSGLKCNQYAEDTQLYLLFSSNPGEAVTALNLSLVKGWMGGNKLKLNLDKTEMPTENLSFLQALRSSNSSKMQGTAVTRKKGFFTRKMGPLQRQLRQGEYGLFKFSPMFESDFVQISKQGGPIEIHNQEQIVTVGITSTNPLLLIPNVLLLARPTVSPEEQATKPKSRLRHHPRVRFELTRLFPLRFVKITVHNAERQQLRFKLASGRTFYLQLCSESDRREELFDAWVRIVQLLRPPSDGVLEEQKEKAKKLKGSGSASPQCTAAQKSIRKIQDASKTADDHQDETKKSSNPAKPSGSSSSLQVIALPPSAKHGDGADPPPPMEVQKPEEKLKESRIEKTPSQRRSAAKTMEEQQLLSVFAATLPTTVHDTSIVSWHKKQPGSTPEKLKKLQ